MASANGKPLGQTGSAAESIGQFVVAIELPRCKTVTDVRGIRANLSFNSPVCVSALMSALSVRLNPGLTYVQLAHQARFT